MQHKAVFIGVVLTTIAAIAALLLTTVFAIASDGLLFRIILGALITVPEVVYLIRRKQSSKNSKNLSPLEVTSSVLFVSATSLGLSRWAEYSVTRSMAASDFAQDYLAAYALRHGVEIFGSPLRSLGSQMLQLHNLDNYHPPFNALLFLPFSFVHYPWAFVLWNFLSLLTYVGLVLILLRSYDLLTFRWLRLSSVLLLWEPFTSSIFLGQLSVTLSFGIIASLFLLRSQHDRFAGFSLGLVTLIKFYPGLILLYLVSQRRWRCATTFVATIVGGSLLTIFVIGSETFLYYVQVIVPEQMRLFATYPLNISMGSGVRTLFEPTLFSQPPIFAPTIGQLTAVLMSGSLIFCVTAFSYVYKDPKYTDDLYSLFCVTMLLVSPITWYHSCVLLLLPFGVLTHSVVANDTSTSWTTLLLIIILCGVPNQDLIDGLRELKSTNVLPWYVILSARTGLFGLVLLYWVFWKSLARNAGYSSVPKLLDSLGLRLLRP